MNPSELQEEIKDLIASLQKKQQEIDEAKKSDAIFEERMRLHLEMKELNNRLKASLEKSNLEHLLSEDYLTQ
jgi:regulator of replication initiation timing